MSTSEVECYVCGNRFGLPQGAAMPRRCPHCHGTFLAKRVSAPERREEQMPVGTPRRDDLPTPSLKRLDI